MLYHAKNGCLQFDDTTMDYVCFGSGCKKLLIIPGLGDALKTVRGTALAMAVMYRQYAKDYQVYVFSRKNKLAEGYTTRDMAKDLAVAMNHLGINSASVMGVSQGGMISQYLAIDHPQMVEKLVLAVTVSRQNQTVQRVVGSWIAMAKDGDYKSIMIDTIEKSCSEKTVKRYKPLYPLLSRIGKPKDFGRFIIQANACLTHDVYDQLGKIQCPTLVIGGDSDRVVGKNTSEEIYQKIDGSKLVLYQGLGHMAYDEAPDFNDQVLAFLA